MIRAGGTGGQNLTRNQDKERAGEAEGASTPCTHRGGPPRRGSEGKDLRNDHTKDRRGGKGKNSSGRWRLRHVGSQAPDLGRRAWVFNLRAVACGPPAALTRRAVQGFVRHLGDGVNTYEPTIADSKEGYISLVLTGRMKERCRLSPKNLGPIWGEGEVQQVTKLTILTPRRPRRGGAGELAPTGSTGRSFPRTLKEMDRRKRRTNNGGEGSLMATRGRKSCLASTPAFSVRGSGC